MAGTPVPRGGEGAGPEAFAGLLGVVLLLGVFAVAVAGIVQSPAGGDHPAAEVVAEGFAVFVGGAVGGDFAARDYAPPVVGAALGRAGHRTVVDQTIEVSGGLCAAAVGLSGWSATASRAARTASDAGGGLIAGAITTRSGFPDQLGSRGRLPTDLPALTLAQ